MAKNGKLSKWSQDKIDALALNAEYNGMEHSTKEEEDSCQRATDEAKATLEKRVLYLEERIDNKNKAIKVMYSPTEVLALIEKVSSLHTAEAALSMHNEIGTGSSGLSKSMEENIDKYFDIGEFDPLKWVEDNLTKGK